MCLSFRSEVCSEEVSCLASGDDQCWLPAHNDGHQQRRYVHTIARSNWQLDIKYKAVFISYFLCLSLLRQEEKRVKIWCPCTAVSHPVKPELEASGQILREFFRPCHSSF